MWLKCRLICILFEKHSAGTAARLIVRMQWTCGNLCAVEYSGNQSEDISCVTHWIGNWKLVASGSTRKRKRGDRGKWERGDNHCRALVHRIAYNIVSQTHDSQNYVVAYHAQLQCPCRCKCGNWIVCVCVWEFNQSANTFTQCTNWIHVRIVTMEICRFCPRSFGRSHMVNIETVIDRKYDWIIMTFVFASSWNRDNWVERK